jgi:hypothetical protein
MYFFTKKFISNFTKKRNKIFLLFSSGINMTLFRSIGTEASNIIKAIPLGLYEEMSSYPFIISIDGDNEVTSSQTNVIVQGYNFGDVEGQLFLHNSPSLDDSTISVEQSIDSWSDTSIQFDVSVGTLLD